MPQNPAAQTAFGPMVLVAVEQTEPTGRPLTTSPIEWTAYAEKT
ncbi:hypothetical protein [Mycobacterium sp.]